MALKGVLAQQFADLERIAAGFETANAYYVGNAVLDGVYGLEKAEICLGYRETTCATASCC